MILIYLADLSSLPARVAVDVAAIVVENVLHLRADNEQCEPNKGT